MSNHDIATRYVALWNEADPSARRTRIEELFTVDGRQVLVDPPAEARKAAADLAVPAPPLSVHGHDALDRRVTRAYEMFLASGEYVFAAAGPAVELPANTVGVAWTMNRRDDGEPQGGGFDLLALDADGRIVSDHQFIEGSR
ncbi:hypothetical protein [Nocardia cyriacigeorgica]|uniref:Nuclear transport factor 2 family protein n=1 Tax=Nocardia cyriacigeorgica TaxID=135487 RepID=A0A4U8W8I7_9NOCA|nr:hypothetical protein [Nocardia cyriacigeorgica]VFB01646.1 Uncharacterised protein [Nocardia cyriacigeorgica]